MNTKTDIEALMRPRYKVIADYPFSKDRIGDILELVIDRAEIWDNCRTGKRANINPKEFPAIFKPLAWYEDREVSEMPEYVKSISTALSMKIGEVCKVKAWAQDIAKNGVWLEGKSFSRLIETVVPATESDYLQYINNQNKK